MDFKKIRKNIGRFLGFLGLKSCSLVIKILPGACLYSFAKGIACLSYALVKKQRNLALASLEIAFGNDKSHKEREQIAKDCFVFMAKSGVELLFLMDRPELLKKRVEIIGKDNLDNALSKGKGVILASAHFGNFPLMMVRLSLEGYKTAAIMRPMRDSRVENFFESDRERLKIKTIYSFPRNTCVNNTIQSLRSNELVFIPLDQNFGTGGVFVDFFGRKAATATGPIVLARRTGAAIIPCFIIRQKDDTHKIVFEKPLELEEGKDDKEDILINIQKLTVIIESYIRKYPAEWSWIHRRWKSQMKQESL